MKTGPGGANTVVCETFDGGTDNLNQVVVLGNKISTGPGKVRTLYCLASAEIEEGTGGIQEIKYQTMEQLVTLALELTGITASEDRPVW